jgi:hypothetical protein
MPRLRVEGLGRHRFDLLEQAAVDSDLALPAPAERQHRTPLPLRARRPRPCRWRARKNETGDSARVLPGLVRRQLVHAREPQTAASPARRRLPGRPCSAPPLLHSVQSTMAPRSGAPRSPRARAARPTYRPRRPVFDPGRSNRPSGNEPDPFPENRRRNVYPHELGRNQRRLRWRIPFRQAQMFLQAPTLHELRQAGRSSPSIPRYRKGCFVDGMVGSHRACRTNAPTSRTRSSTRP